MAMIAKWVAPMDAERAAKALAAMIPALRYPDAAFCEASARAVALDGLMLPGGKTGPMHRVPTFGEIDRALGLWWLRQRESAALAAQPEVRIAAPEWQPAERPNAEVQAAVSTVVRGFVAERTPSAKPAATPRAAPRPIAPAQLLATWEKAVADKVPGAEARVAMLRKQIEASSAEAARRAAAQAAPAEERA